MRRGRRWTGSGRPDGRIPSPANDGPDRFHFYLHDDAPRSAMRAWAEADFSLDRVDEGVRDWKDLHRLLGLDLNVRIVEHFLDEV